MGKGRSRGKKGNCSGSVNADRCLFGAPVSSSCTKDEALQALHVKAT